MAFRYGNTLKTVYLVCFYVYILPHTVLLGVLCIFIQYWINKYVLLRRHSRPPRLGGQLSHAMRNMLELIPICMLAGAYLFEQDLYGKNSTQTWSALIGAICLYVLLKDSSYDETNQVTDGANEYEVHQYMFQTNYDRENPVTREEATQRYLKGLIEQAEYLEGKDELRKMI